MQAELATHAGDAARYRAGEIAAYGSSARWARHDADDEARAMSASVGPQRELARYQVPEGNRAVVTQRIDGRVAISDMPAGDTVEEVEQPSERELERLGTQLQKGLIWTELFPGLARLTLEEDEGMRYSIRVAKHDEAPGVRLVRPDEDAAEDSVAIIERMSWSATSSA